MNELKVKVKVQQTPGTVTWNYEDLKKAITNALEVYKTTEYDDSNIGQAKKDRAMLNNLSNSCTGGSERKSGLPVPKK